MDWLNGIENASELGALLAELRLFGGDNAEIEVKSAEGGLPSDVAVSVCALSNLPLGGLLVLGVKETNDKSKSEKFSICGLRDPQKIEQQLTDAVRKSVQPVPPHLDHTKIRVNGQVVLVTKVSPQKPECRPATVNNVAYQRQSDSDYRMSEEEVCYVREVAKGQPSRERDTVKGLTKNELASDLTEMLAKSVRAGSRRLSDSNDEEILHALQAITATGEPTVAGLYALGKYPQGACPDLEVTAAVKLPYTPGRQRRTEDLRHFDGPLPDLLEETTRWCARNLKQFQEYDQNGNMRDVPELPLRAIREIIANALVHRDLGPFTQGKRVNIRLLHDRLVITSPGGLRGITAEQLRGRMMYQSAVNPRLYNIAKHLKTVDGDRLIEGEGGGLLEAINEMEARGLPAPRFVDNGTQFTVILMREAATPQGAGIGSARTEGSSSEDEPQIAPEPAPDATAVTVARDPESTLPAVGDDISAAILRELAEVGRPLTMRDLAVRIDMSTNHVRYRLKKLTAQGLLRMDGGRGRRDTRYRLIVADDPRGS